MKNSIYSLLISALLFSCNTKDDYIQEVYVNELIDLSLPAYSELITTGSSILIDDIGVDGIIIYHGIGQDYKVYDRNCSYEPSRACSFIDSVSSGIAYCGCCPSFFLISDNGRSLYGPALLPLKRYNWSLDNNILRISN
ncbi:hypothetical protein OAK24_01235 [Flavobacteriales bacterium]|nr:hypothetical protein [Flavobacteriales bacterium]